MGSPIALILVCWLRKQAAIVVFLESFGSVTPDLSGRRERGDRLFAVLDSIVVRFFGRISYSFYLLHMIGLSLAVRTVPPSSILYFVFGVAYTAPMAWLSWRLVEKQFISLGRRFDVNHFAGASFHPRGAGGQEVGHEPEAAS
ncbi:MAG: hypothetical protein E6G70_31560 [Alphaproteobacteria bacterium]|nr:MAG: hypothetical protein E6G70_31560 [Alphaproteobacteria bacterium]